MGTPPLTGQRDPERTDPLAFAGADRLVRLIGALYRRPRVGDRPRELDPQSVDWKPGYQQERSGRRGLPMVCLVGPAAEAGVLPEFRRLFEEARPDGVRHAYLSLSGQPVPDPRGPATHQSVEVVRSLLWDARNELIRNPKARGSRLGFPLFTLVVWLMNQVIPAHEANPDRTLRRLIQKIGLTERFRSTLKEVDDQLLGDKPAWKVPLALVRMLTVLTFRIAVTGRVPVLSGQYRWFLRQPHLAPEMSGSFPRFARRLTDGEWQEEAPEYVSRLLVNAFLEDLRRAHQLRPWQFWRRRRMTYPVLLLDSVGTDNGGYRLLELINAVRNQVGLFDPLLVLSASDAAPPDAKRGTGRPRYTAENAADAYRVWQNMLRDDRRARRDTAWYLPIGIEEPAEPSVAVEARGKLDSLGDPYQLRPRQARPPWWASRWTRIGAPLVVLVLVAALFVVQHNRTIASHCGTDSVWLSFSNGECVGMTDGSHDLFQPSDATIRQVEQQVLDQNRDAAAEHEASPGRPYITLVDLEALTSSNGRADGLTAEREALEGLAVAQQRQLHAPAASDPIVRVLFADGGYAMKQGEKVAGMLRDLADQDNTIVGVVGLDNSSEPTQRTIRALTQAGIPMVASTLSADVLADLNPMYFQVTPQNRREAAVAASFAATLPGPARSVRVYYSDDDTDIYSTNLRDDAVKSFQDKGFQAEARAFTPDGWAGGPASHERYPGERLVGNAQAAGSDTCSYNGFVFFAGRGVPDYGEFVESAAKCSSTAVFIGDDDVSRYVADRLAREHNRATPYYYMTFATAPVTDVQGVARDFYATLSSLFPFENTPQGRSLDGHAAMAYDASQVFITATAYLRETADHIPVTPGAVWREITAIHTSQPNPRQTNKYIEGVTGAIDYGGDLSRNVPESKPVAILQVENGEVDTTLRGFCGRADRHTSDSWCPPGD